jgi:uncharacterized protein (DUF1697 family)
MTETYLALLRGINVGGQKMISMDELKMVLGELGLTRIRTYIQSGNLIFESDNNDTVDLAAGIAGKILERFGFTVPVIIRTMEELENICRNNPLLAENQKNADKMHVTFLSEKPGRANENSLKEKNFLPDEFVVTGKEVYLYCPNGYGRTKLTNQFFESKLKVTATTRNWRTVGEVLRMNNEQ